MNVAPASHPNWHGISWIGMLAACLAAVCRGGALCTSLLPALDAAE